MSAVTLLGAVAQVSLEPLAQAGALVAVGGVAESPLQLVAAQAYLLLPQYWAQASPLVRG